MKFRKLPKAIKKAVSDEVIEIKGLIITEADEKEAKILTRLIVAAFNAYGVPVPENIQNFLITVLKYGIRDIKEGCKTKDKLIIKRIINEFNKI